MGVVFAAYDPELDRRVAVKLLKATSEDPEGQRRLLAEAQALARLSHPHVVAIHDVGTYDAGSEQGVFLALELVEGETLGAWLRSARRTPREILEVFAQAGRGLAAAHRAGLVHRDVKPSNLLVGRDGRVRVTDFGLARPLEPSGDPEADSEPGLLAPRAGESSEPSAGTPAYMAPEQYEGRADARSDQFGFCVALWEALFGELPFSAVGFSAVGARRKADPLDAGRAYRTAILRGDLREPRDTAVPTRLVRILRRGLAAHPEHRYPSMDALVAELTDDPAARRRRWLVAAMLGVSVGLTAWGLGQWSGQPEAPCRGADDKIEAVWRAETRASLRQIEQRIGDYVEAWKRMHRETCEASLRGEQSDALLDRRMLCLDRQLRTFAAWRVGLQQADPETLRRAVDGAGKLRLALHACSDAERLLERTAPPEGVSAEALERLETGLAEVRAGLILGRYEATMPRAREHLQEARLSGWPVAEAEAAQLLGDLALQTGDVQTAEAAYAEAYRRADAGRDHHLRVQSRIGLVWARGLMAGDPTLAFEELALAQATAEGLRGEASRRPLALQLARTESAAHLLAGDYPAALRSAQKAVDLARRRQELEAGPEAVDPTLFHVLTSLGEAHFQAGSFARARTAWEEALEVGAAVYGESHPNLCDVGGSLGRVDRQLGRDQEAVQRLAHALEACRAAYGPESEDVAGLWTSLGLAQLRAGDVEGALASHRRSLAIRESLWGPEDPRLGSSLNNLGMTLMEAGAEHRPEALETLRRALVVKEGALGDAHPKLISTLLNLGELMLDLDRPQEARALVQRADGLARQAVDEGHPYRREVERLLLDLEMRDPRFEIAPPGETG